MDGLNAILFVRGKSIDLTIHENAGMVQVYYKGFLIVTMQNLEKAFVTTKKLFEKYHIR